jgi:prepilin-type processing-associated H-X9-DG protein
VSFFDPANQPAVAVQLKVLQCPSAPADRWVTAADGDGAFVGGGEGVCTDYGPVSGVDPDLTQLGLIDPAGGLPGRPTGQRHDPPDRVTDGTSNTLLVAEDAGRPQMWRAGRYVPGIFSFGGPWASSANPVLVAGASADGATEPGPCAVNCTNDQQVYSFHPGGAQALFADGSVHFLHAGMDVRTLAALATRAGGEVVPGGDW